ncbi:hypothetical protein [Deminuibacter soli]|nr:hypothetical protein [Deminuibacter soli]
MKEIIYLCISAALMTRCGNVEMPKQRMLHRTTGEVRLVDSLEAARRAVAAFNNSVANCKDSIVKYNLVSVNDTCLKYIYVMNGSSRLRYRDSLFVSQCTIKLTGFEKKDNNICQLQYTVFICDSVPIIADLTDEAIVPMIHTAAYSLTEKKISRIYVGQETAYMKERDLEKAYQYALSDKSKQAFFPSHYQQLDPEFIRLYPLNIK